MCTEKLKFHLVHKFVVHKLVYFKNNAYICTQNSKYTSIWKEHLYMECL